MESEEESGNKLVVAGYLSFENASLNPNCELYAEPGSYLKLGEIDCTKFDVRDNLKIFTATDGSLSAEVYFAGELKLGTFMISSVFAVTFVFSLVSRSSVVPSPVIARLSDFTSIFIRTTFFPAGTLTEESLIGIHLFVSVFSSCCTGPAYFTAFTPSGTVSVPVISAF